jgi:hypothetical protein
MSSAAAEAPASAPHVVIIVPGIRDRGGKAWEAVAIELRAAGMVPVTAGWDEYFGVARFLVPFAFLFRGPAGKRLLGRIDEAISKYTRERVLPTVSYIAHSFGSYALCHLLARETRLQAKRVILCGSVLAWNFDFASWHHRVDGPVLNEVGQKDYWPLVASAITFGYGAIGTFGYNGASVRNRYHLNGDHSTFSKPGFCTSYWVPFLLADGESHIVEPPKTGDENRAHGIVTTSVLRVFQHLKWVLLGILAWICLAFPANSYCDAQLVANDNLRESLIGRVYAIGNVLCHEAPRVRDQSTHVCRHLPRFWPVTVRWPAATSITVDECHGGAVDRLFACADEVPASVSWRTGIEAIAGIDAIFPKCVDLGGWTIGSPTMTLRLSVDSTRVTKVVTGGDSPPSYACGCDLAAVQQLRDQLGVKE